MKNTVRGTLLVLMLAGGSQMTPACQRDRVAESTVVTEEKAAEPVSDGPERLIRLVERLSDADVSSPLENVGEVGSLAELEGRLERRVIFEESFERFNPAQAHWRLVGGSAIDTTRRNGESTRALAYRGGGGHEYYFLLPVRPQAHYRISRLVKTEAPLVDFVVAECSTALTQPASLNHPDDHERIFRGRFVGASSLIYVHRFSRPTIGRWSSGAIDLFTTPQTRAIAIVLQDTEAVTERRKLTTWLDELQVEQLEPSPEQELALLKSRQRLSNDDELGMTKHGQLLPTRDADRVEPPFDHNFDFRQAVFAPAPTRIAFELKVPPEARFSFSMALDKASRPGDEALFTVSLRDSGGIEHQMMQRRIRIEQDGGGWHWYDEQLPLSEHAGERVTLILSTSAPEKGRGYALWGNPIIDSPRAEDDPPNVLLIGVDTLRADRMHCYGHQRETTPRLDAMAREGVLFERAMSPTNWTTPAFASLFTGLMPSSHRVTHRTRSIARAIHTLPERFREAGWLTHGVSYKAYLYNMGFEQGFDTWFNVPRQEVRGDDNLQKALGWLEKNHDRRFFLFLHFNDPHQPFNQPEPYDRRYNTPQEMRALGASMPMLYKPDGTVSGCRKCRDDGHVREEAKKLAFDLYDGSVAYTDALVGRLLDALRDYGVYEDTIIAFVSDHGEVMWEHDNYFGHGGPRLGDELIHVPLIIKPAAESSADHGVRVRSQVSTVDLVPTLLEMSGLETTSDLQGRSLMSVMTAAEASKAEQRLIISETGGVFRHLVAVRDEQWKYVLIRDFSKEQPQELLYDLRSDPGEHREASAQHPDQARRLRTVALDFILQHQPGRYVVFVGDGEQRTYGMRLGGKRSMPQLSLFTRAPLRQWTKVNRLAAQATTDDPLLLVARVDEPDDEVVTIELRAPDVRANARLTPGEELPAYSEGRLRSLIEARELGIHLFGGRTVAPAPEETTIFDADKLETLKALGYVDE